MWRPRCERDHSTSGELQVECSVKMSQADYEEHRKPRLEVEILSWSNVESFKWGVT